VAPRLTGSSGQRVTAPDVADGQGARFCGTHRGKCATNPLLATTIKRHVAPNLPCGYPCWKQDVLRAQRDLSYLLRTFLVGESRLSSTRANPRNRRCRDGR
jgi:hypothetical protein